MNFFTAKEKKWIKNYIPKVVILLLMYLMVTFVQLPIVLMVKYPDILLSPLKSTLYVIIYFLAFIIAILIARRVYLSHTYQTPRRVTWKDILLIVKCYVLAIIIEMLLGYLNNIFFSQSDTANNQVIYGLMSSNHIVLIMLAISAVCFSPILEELVFRGFAMDAFFGPKWFGFPIIFSGIIFSMGHESTNIISFLIYVSLGMFLGYVYRRSGNIRVSMLMHAFNNFLAMVLMLIMLLH